MLELLIKYVFNVLEAKQKCNVKVGPFCSPNEGKGKSLLGPNRRAKVVKASPLR